MSKDQEYMQALGRLIEPVDDSGQIPLTAQIAVVEAILNMTPYLIKNNQNDLLTYLDRIAYYLMGVNNAGVLNFWSVYEYSGYIGDAIREGKDPLTYELAVESRNRALKELAAAKSFYKQKTKKTWGERYAGTEPEDTPERDFSYLGEYIYSSDPITLRSQIAITETVLNIAPYLAANKQTEFLKNLHSTLFFLMEQNTHGTIDFVKVSKYLDHLRYTFREQSDPSTDERAAHMRESIQEDLEKAKEIYKLKTKKNWGEH